LLNSTFDVIPTGLREGTLHSWNVAYQRELPYRFTVDVAYVGNKASTWSWTSTTKPEWFTEPATRAAAICDVQSHWYLAYPHK
jgi:hypothetical protein